MTPQEKQVFSKLFPKTELQNQRIELASIKEIFQIVQNCKKYVNAINTDMGSASSKVGNAFKEYEKAKKEINDTLLKIKDIDPALLNSDEGKKVQRWLGEVNSDLSTLKELRSDITKIGSIAAKFKI
jgi:seryl-tRNA synthetase